jgi:hypothetical protein
MTLLMSHCIEAHPESSPVECCVSFWNVMASANDQGNYFQGWDKKDALQYWNSYAEAVAPYTLRKNYKRIDGRPVLFHGLTHTLPFYAQFGVYPWDITKAIREVIPDAYLVATATEREYYVLLKEWGFDAFTEYRLEAPTWEEVVETYRWFWDKGIETCKTHNLDYWVPYTSGYDASAWGRTSPRTTPTPSQFSAHVKEARAFATKHHKYTKSQLIGYSWNEWGESPTPIEPSVLHGDSYLRAHREACT